jgi:serine O-acetyltransferase
MKPGEKAHSELETIVDAVASSYGAGRKVDNLESAALPNRRKVNFALGQLKHVIYMGFYSTRALNRANLRQHLGEHIYEAFDILVEQVSRAVAYDRCGGGEPGCDAVEWSERVILDVFREIPKLREAMALDVAAAYDGDPAAKSIEETIFSYPGIEAITVYRIAHEFYKREVPMIPRIMTELAHADTGIDIHPGAVIGASLFIDHGTGVVIGETARIGDNVKLYQGVTLGALSIQRDAHGVVIRDRKRHPTIENDVTIYAGATILGGETVIGAGSTIGGNVWLTESVPPSTRVTYLRPSTQTAERARPKASREG